MKFVLTTDTSCDERKNVMDELDIPWIPLTYTLDGEVYPDNFSADEEYQAFYKKIEQGGMPVTSQISPEQHREFFAKVVKEKNAQAIVHLSLSGGLSTTALQAQKGAELYMQENPNVKIYCVDTVLATQVHNILMYEAVKLRDADMSAQDAFEKLEDIKMHIQPWFMVDDLHHLKRGGRVSSVAAIFGTLLNIKPILIIDKDGTLKVVNKVMGVKKAIDFFVDTIKRQSDELPSEVFIIHANVPETAKQIEEKIHKTYPSIKTRIGWLGPVIGSHCGSGMIGVGFIGKHR